MVNWLNREEEIYQTTDWTDWNLYHGNPKVHIGLLAVTSGIPQK